MFICLDKLDPVAEGCYYGGKVSLIFGAEMEIFLQLLDIKEGSTNITPCFVCLSFVI